MNDAASHAFLSTFRNAAAAMGLDPIAGGRVAPAIAAKQDWIWEYPLGSGDHTECTEERAKRYVEAIGGRAFSKASMIAEAEEIANEEREPDLRDEVQAVLDARMMSEHE